MERLKMMPVFIFSLTGALLILWFKRYYISPLGFIAFLSVTLVLLICIPSIILRRLEAPIKQRKMYISLMVIPLLSIFILHTFRTQIFSIEFYKIEGISMSPTLLSGDTVIVDLSYREEKISSGDILVFQLNDKVLVKRVVALKKEYFTVSGDNSNSSYKSETMGEIPFDAIIGQVSFILFSTNNYSKPSRLLKRIS